MLIFHFLEFFLFRELQNADLAFVFEGFKINWESKLSFAFVFEGFRINGDSKCYIFHLFLCPGFQDTKMKIFLFFWGGSEHPGSKLMIILFFWGSPRFQEFKMLIFLFFLCFRVSRDPKC